MILKPFFFSLLELILKLKSTSDVLRWSLETFPNVRLHLCCFSIDYALLIGFANNFFNKNNFKIGSYGTIHTFKNYFITVFSNKWYPNIPLIKFIKTPPKSISNRRAKHKILFTLESKPTK